MDLIGELPASEHILKSPENLTDGMRVALCRVVGDMRKGIDSGKPASPGIAQITLSFATDPTL